MNKGPLSKRAEKFLVIGQSDSLVQVENSSEGLKVVKSSPSKNLRFNEQYLKHKVAEKMMEPLFVPRVLSSLKDFRYEMEYVKGMPLGSFIETCDQLELQAPLDGITNYFDRLLRDADWNKTKEMKIAFEEKLKVLRLGINSNHQSGILFDKLLNYSFAQLEKIEIPGGWNHGDFSFENILVGQYSHQIFALDFLDSPFESPLIDIGRIWLDCRYGWWGAGLHANSSYQLNSKVLSDAILKTISAHSISARELNVFASLAILRIRPYTLNPLRMAFLKNSALQILGGKL